MEKKNLQYQHFIYTCDEKLAACEKEKSAFEEEHKEVLAHVEKVAARKKELEEEYNKAVSKRCFQSTKLEFQQRFNPRWMSTAAW